MHFNSNRIQAGSSAAYNTTPGRDKFHPKGRDNGYILTLGGTRIYIAGDTEDIPELKQVKDIDTLSYQSTSLIQ